MLLTHSKPVRLVNDRQLYLGFFHADISLPGNRTQLQIKGKLQQGKFHLKCEEERENLAIS